MRICDGEDGAMGRRWRWAWAAVIAVAIGVVGVGPAQAQQPQGKAPAAASAALGEAKRLCAGAAHLYKEGKYDAALALEQRCLAIQEKALGPNHPDVARTLNNLASLYKGKRDYERAGPLYQRSLAIQEKALGPNHPDVAISLDNLAWLYRDKGDYERAEPLYQRSLAIREKALGPEHPRVATSLNNLAGLYNDKGDYERAEPLYQRSLAIREKALGPNHPDVAISLNNLAWLYRDKGDYERAEPLYRRCLAIREKALGPNHPDVAISLNNVADLYGKKRDYERAEPLYRRSLAIWEKALGPNHPQVARTLNNLALLYNSKGDYEQAEPLYRRSLAIWEKALGPNHPDVASSLNNLAGLYNEKGEYERAEPLFRRSLTIREKALGPDHPRVATTLNNLAGLYQKKGEYERAEPLFRRSLAIMEKALGPNHPDVAVSLNNLAWLHKTKGEYLRAEPLYRRSLAIMEKALGPNHPDVAVSLNNLAGLYSDKGDYERAESLYQRSLVISEKALGPDHPGVATTLNNLAFLYKTNGEYERAEPLYQRSLVIFEKALGPNHPDVATSLNNLAALYQEKGDYERAESLYQRSLVISEKALGPDHPGVATTLNNLAMLHQEKGEYEQAEPLYRRSLAIQEKALGPNHPNVATAWRNLSGLDVAQGRAKQAVNAAHREAVIDDRNAAALLATGSEEQKRLYVDSRPSGTSWAISLHVQHAPVDPAAARLAVTVLLRRKARILDAMTDSLAALRRSLAPGDRELLDRLASVYSRLATEVSRGPGKASAEQYRKRLAALENDRQALEADISRRSAVLRAEQRLVSLPEVQAAIPEGAALVEIARYKPFNPRAAQAQLWGEPRYVAYVLWRSGEPTFVDLGEAAAIDAAVETLRRSLADHDLTHDPTPAARALDALLMQPIRKLLGDTRWVFISADGPLHLIPFGALANEQGHYLVERYLFSYLTTGRDLIRFSDQRNAPRDAPLVLANPAFDNSSAQPGPEATHRGVRSIDMVTQPLLPLGGTVEEANTIHSLFPDSRVLLGADATEEAVKNARAPRLLHLATHGFFLPEQPVPELLLSAPGAEPSAAERAAILQRENPLLRSGIALAGFNRRKSGSDDGVLTALEVAGLDLYGTRLVVLSACETGIGHASSGEGIYGLRRALTIAGSQTQVMSLWQVDTGRTRELMQAYYERLQQGEGRGEAMRQVQLAMLADPATSHPNLWASFIVSGEWRPLDGVPAMPDSRVHPGPRGCACSLAAEGQSWSSWVFAVLAGATAAARRRPRSWPRGSWSRSFTTQRHPRAARCGRPESFVKCFESDPYARQYCGLPQSFAGLS